MTAVMRYYDPQGNPGTTMYGITDDARRVARTDGLTFAGQPVYVSTVLIAGALVLQGAEIDKPFETQVRTDDDEGLPMWVWRFPTRELAEGTHEALVTLLRTVVEAGNEVEVFVSLFGPPENGPEPDGSD